MISTVTKEYNKDNTIVVSYSVTLDDGKFLSVPPDENNRHYQQIMDWVAEGNTIIDPEA